MSTDEDTILDIRGQTNTPTTLFAVPVRSMEPVRSERITDAIVADPDAQGPTDRDIESSRYEPLEKIGGGAMAEVYKAKDTMLSSRDRDEFVALKVFGHDSPFGEQAEERIRIEVRAARRIRSPHVCGVHNLVRFEDGRFAIPMELIEGRTLAALVRDGLEIDYLRFARWGIEIATGLAAAHSVDVVHRDLKPENIIMRDADDSAVILDFGVAKFFADDIALTQKGMAVGTPLYMAPEQFGGKIDPRADLFALGLILALLATGEVPNSGDRSAKEIYRLRVLEPKPYRLKEQRPNAPTEYAMIVDRLLDFAKDGRFQTGAHVVDALRGFIRNAEAKTNLRLLSERSMVLGLPDTVPLSRRPRLRLRPLLRHRSRLTVAAVISVIMAIASVIAVLANSTGWLVGPVGQVLTRNADAPYATEPPPSPSPSNVTR